jgi:predicted pyridoxine 5'-phosphate oxidase superfamily flavin-nucleotide-binding protein
MTMYRETHRALQDRFDTRRLADRLEEVKVRAELSEADARFVAERDMLFLATCDEDGQPTCSFKAGDKGFARVLSPRALVFPWYDGNGMFLSAGNVAATSRVGLLFIDFESPRRLRIEGEAALIDEEELLASYPGAQFVIQVDVLRVYPNCPRYIPKYQLVEPSVFIPRTDHRPPMPDWKRADWARGVLPARDAARMEPPSPRLRRPGDDD